MSLCVSGSPIALRHGRVPRRRHSVAMAVPQGAASVEIFDYPGAGHLFPDPSLGTEYDADFANLLWSRVLPFCASPSA